MIPDIAFPAMGLLFMALGLRFWLEAGKIHKQASRNHLNGYERMRLEIKQLRQMEAAND